MDKKFHNLLDELEEFGKKNFMFNVPRETGEFLNFLVKIKKPRKILEIGMSNGYSTIWLAEPGFPVVTIEKDSEKIKLAKENFRNFENITILEGNALEVLRNLDEEFDFVFIDATKKEYIDYFKLVKFDKNAIVIADNIISHDLKEYSKFVRDKFDSFLVKIGSGLEVTTVP